MVSSSIPIPGDVALIPFEFLDRTGTKIRPGVVISNRVYSDRWLRFVFMPISNSPGPVEGAIEIQDLGVAGLNRRSYCQGIIWTSDIDDIDRIIGRLSSRDISNIRKLIRSVIAI